MSCNHYGEPRFSRVPIGWGNPCLLYNPINEFGAKASSIYAKAPLLYGGDSDGRYFCPASTFASQPISIPGSYPAKARAEPESFAVAQPDDRYALIDSFFQARILNRNEDGEVNKVELDIFCKEYPKGLILHEHLGCHENTTLQFAMKANLFWDQDAKTLSQMSTARSISVQNLNLQKNDEIREAFFATITQSKITAYKDIKEANSHFHATFVQTGIVGVPDSVKLAEAYLDAEQQKLQGSHVMVDFPTFNCVGGDAISENFFEAIKNPEELTDELLERFASSIDQWTALEAEACREYLITQESQAREILTRAGTHLVGSMFETDNPILITILAEIGKTHSNMSEDGRLGALLFRFACDVGKAIQLESICSYVKTINCVGPEHLTEPYELFLVRILDFYFHRSVLKREIALHIGELCSRLASATQMSSRIGLLKQSHAKRAGHATCIVRPKDLAYLRDNAIPVEVCPTACKRLMGERHPTKRFIDAGVPIVVNTDNMHVFITSQSREWYLTLKRWDGVTYQDVLTLARNSIEFSDLDGESILHRSEGHYTVKPKFNRFITMPDVESNYEFRLMPEKQKVQIRHERAVFEYEEKILEREKTGRLLSASPPKAAARSLLPESYSMLKYVGTR